MALDKDSYYLQVAYAVRERSTCTGSTVGAVLVKGDRIVATGYNGTPEYLPNCGSGGCTRCAHRGTVFQSGEAYDICICVHAEANAVLSAARYGGATDGSWLYCTHRPCFSCAKELIQAGVVRVFYSEEMPPVSYPLPEIEAQLRGDYERLATHLTMEQIGPQQIAS